MNFFISLFVSLQFSECVFSSVLLTSLYSWMRDSFFSPCIISLQLNEGFFLHPFNISLQLNEGSFFSPSDLSTIEWGILSSSLYSSVSDYFIRTFIFSLLFTVQWPKQTGQFCLPRTWFVVIGKKEYTCTQKPRQWSGDVTANVCVSDRVRCEFFHWRFSLCFWPSQRGSSKVGL